MTAFPIASRSATAIGCAACRSIREASRSASWLLTEFGFEAFVGKIEFPPGIPDWQGRAGVYYFDSTAGGHLELKAGLRSRLSAKFVPDRFDERRLVYFRGTGASIGRTGTLDAVVIGHIGDAYVHLIWENLLNRKYVTTDFYPMSDRVITFGVSWDFLN